MNSSPIDFVVPWVDSSDPIWQKNFNRHIKLTNNKNIDFSDKRYRDWGLFKYWFRGVEKFAPWVNRVHLITSGHYPEWLNLNHPKINFVRHEDYIPHEYLPTFSSHPIELNIHRIESLSEKFVYFNDDMFIKGPLDKSWFFKNDKPCDSAIITAFSGTGFTTIVFNNNNLINRNFSKLNAIKRAPFNWFNPRYGSQIIRTFSLLPWKEFTGFYIYHLPSAFLKSTLNEVWLKEGQILGETCTRKFRHDLDINQYIFRDWQLASNNFHPIGKHKLGDFLQIGVDPINKITSKLLSPDKPIICLNDHNPKNLTTTIQTLQDTFEKILPEKSSFEI